MKHETGELEYRDKHCSAAGRRRCVWPDSALLESISGERPDGRTDDAGLLHAERAKSQR